jgi:DNA-binding SARP family transcriptional activator/WD40 repeat protein
VLGPILAHRGELPLDTGGPKQRAVLGVLVADVGSPVSAGTILTAVWGEDTPESHRRSLHTYVSNLRALLDVEIERTGDSYRIDLPPSQVDAVSFEKELERGRTLIPTDPAAAGERLRRALAMWRGRPYADLAYVEGLQTEIRRLEELRLAAVEARVDADLAAGRHENVLAEVAALAEEHPLRERFRAQHMVALYRSGRQADALRAYERTRSYLSEEMGLEPSQELQDLELSILQHEPWLRQGIGRSTTHRLVFLAAEIRDTDDIWDRDPRAMADALALHDRIAIETIETRGGNPFRVTSEGAVASFPDVESAVRAAEDLQRRLGAIDWGDAPIAVGMGLDIGEAESRGGDFAGPPVTRASRLASAAHGGQVLVSSAVHTVIADSSRARLQVRQLGEHELVGFASAQRVGQLVFDGLPDDFPALRAGERRFDPSLPPALPGYEIREEIGKGTLGRVYRAYQPSVGREVAIKVVPPRLASHPRFIHRFEAEARTVAQLAHPRIVPLIDFWRDAAGAYLVLQLIAGGTLQEAIAAGSLDHEASRRVLHHVGEALDHAHSLGITHGDLKPADVLLDGSGNAYVTSFGMAARLLASDLLSAVSHDTRFAAPEQTTSPAGDLYALGVMARQVITHSAAIGIIDRATADDPADRYPDAASFLVDLDIACGVEPAETIGRAVPRNPFKGLRPFDEGDSGDFFGRSVLIGELVEAVADHRLVAVVGPSGSGKSSVVRAGLLPAVAGGAIDGSENWLRVIFSPGHNPVASLVGALESVAAESLPIEEVLARDGIAAVARRIAGGSQDTLLLVVDQFEELFTLVDDDRLRRDFLDMLIAAVSGESGDVRAVVTLRADFYDRPLEDPRLGPLVRRGLVTVVHPTPAELIDMITGPTRSVGLRWEVGLPGSIAEDVVRQPGGLPLLQYALTELVEKRSGDILSRDDYQRVGGVTGALSTRAETVFAQLSPRRQEAARAIFLRLITVEGDTTDTRRRVRRSELTSMGLDRADVDAVVDAYVAERLLLGDRDPVTRGPTVEVAHESLIREWSRLETWVEEQREALLLLRRLRSAMQEWEEAQRHPGYLLSGSRLAPFLELDRSTTLSGDEAHFLESSRRRDEVDRAGRRRRRRTLTALLVGITGVAVILAGLAFAQSRRAAARELAASAINVLDKDPELSVLLATEAATLAEPGFETVSALHEALYHHRLLWTHQWTGDGDFFTGALSPDGTRLALSGVGRIEVWDLDTNDLVWATDLPGELQTTPYFSRDGSELVGLATWPRLSSQWNDLPAGAEPGVYRWDAASGRQLGYVTGGDCPIWDIGQFGPSIDPGIPVVVAGFAAGETGGDCAREVGTVSLLDIESGTVTPLADVSLHEYRSGLSTTRDGRYVTFTDGRTASIVDSETGENVVRVGTSVWSATLSPEGRYAVLREDSGQLSIIHLEDDRATRLLGPARGDRVRFAADGTRFAHHDYKGEITIFDVVSAKAVGRLVGGAAPATRPEVGAATTSFSSDGSRLAGFGVDGSVRVWSTAPPGEVGSFPVGGIFITAGSVDLVGETGSLLVYPDHPKGGRGVVFDVSTGETLAQIDDRTGQTVSLSPDAMLLASQRSQGDEMIGPVEVHDIQTGSVVQMEGLCTWSVTDVNQPRPPCAAYPQAPFQDWARDLEFSPDGSALALSGGVTGSITIWNPATGEMVFNTGRLMPPTENDPHNDGPTLAFSPRGDRLVVSTRDELLVYDTATWQVTERTPMERMTRFVFTPDGRHLVGATSTPAVLMIDTTTWSISRSLTGHNGHISDLAVSPDSTVIASSDFSGVVRIWDMKSGSPLQAMSLDEQSVQNVEFIESGHLLVTPQTGPNALILTTDVDELIDVARRRVTRGFTTDECRVYLHVDTCPAD